MNKKILFIPFILSILVITGCKFCPSSCDDGIKCTNDFCNVSTNYQCSHNNITPCEGNNKCEKGEYGTKDCPNCTDTNNLTKDYINYQTMECVHDCNDYFDACPFTKLKTQGYGDCIDCGCIDCISDSDNPICTIDRYNAEVDARNECNGFT